PLPIADIIDVDAVIVTHLHPDHWDQAAREALPKDLSVFAQNDIDAEVIRLTSALPAKARRAACALEKYPHSTDALLSSIMRLTSAWLKQRSSELPSKGRS